MPDAPQPALVNVEELARILSVSKDKVYTMAKSREIPAVRVGRQWRFDPAAVRAHLTQIPRGWGPVEVPGQPPHPDPWAQSRRSIAAKAYHARRRGEPS